MLKIYHINRYIQVIIVINRSYHYHMSMRKDIDELAKNAANYTALTPLWFLERVAKVHPTRKSIIHGSRHYTWHQTYQRCRRFASALSNCSVGLGNTVLLYSPSLSFFSLNSIFVFLRLEMVCF
jgi:non-ribosomal peptide synthetase component E (peptide arylation enzyme)